MIKPFLDRNLQRVYYLWMLVSVNTAYVLISIITFLSFLIPKRKKYDLILFPYAQKGSDGYKRRFEVYFEFLSKDNISFKVCNLIDNEELVNIFDGRFGKRYLLYQFIIWKRLWQVLSARHYKYAFFQRGLFPFYPGQRYPYLERLLKKLGCEVTIDFWDADWMINKEITDGAAAFADRISCVNDFIRDYFNFLTVPKEIFPIGVDLTHYRIKNDYSIEEEIKFIYTGLPANVQQFFELAHPIFIELKKHLKFRLIVITRYREKIDEYPVEFYDFEEPDFYAKLVEADIGLYLVPDSDKSRGKMAMKVLDYMSAALPGIATPVGLSPFALDGENILFAESFDEWVDKLIQLKQNAGLRKFLGQNGRKMVEKFHCIESSYLTFKSIVFNNIFH